MISGSSLEIRLLRSGDTPEVVELEGPAAVRAKVVLDQAVSRKDQAELRWRRPSHRSATDRARLTAAGQVVVELEPGDVARSGSLGSIADDLAEVILAVEVERVGSWVLVGVVVVPIAPPNWRAELRTELRDELRRWGTINTLDEAGATESAVGYRAASVVARLGHLRALVARAEAHLGEIREVRRSAQERRTERRRWRPGDAAHRIKRAEYERVRTPSGRVAVRPRHMSVERSVVTYDIEEHRQLLRAFRSLERAATELAREARAVSVELDPFHGSMSPAHRAAMSRGEHDEAQRRAGAVREARQGALDVARRCRTVDARDRWLAGVSTPRGGLRATPTFRRIPAYARLYEFLVELEVYEKSRDISLLDRFRATEELYEVWVFIACLQWAARDLGEERLGELVGRMAWLRPGDAFEFPRPDGMALRFVLEPAIPSITDRNGRSDLPFRATLSRAPLRPDVWMDLIDERGAVIRAVVLDAKCTHRFANGKGLSLGAQLEEITDYRSRIVDEKTGNQPVRGIFQVHPCPGAKTTINVMHLLREEAPCDAYFQGAVAAAPVAPESLHELLSALESWLVMCASNGA